MPTCTVRGLDLHFTRVGEGPDLLLLCGLGDDVSAWDAQVQAFRATRRVTVIDNRGVGRTPLPDGPLSVAELAADAAALCSATGIVEADVAGFSMGGAIAQELALGWPSLVRTLTIVGSWCRSDGAFAAACEALAWQAGVVDADEPFVRSLFALVYSAAMHEDGRVDAYVRAALANPHPQTTEAFVRTARMLRTHDTADRLDAVEAPTLVVCGAEDVLCPPRHSQAIAARIPGARLVEVPAQAHQPFQEDPAAFNRLLATFLEERTIPTVSVR